MGVFSYQGIDSAGAESKGLIEAATTKEARSLLVSRGVTPYSLAPAAAHARLGAEGRADLYRGLGALVNAGFPLERALGLLMDESAADERNYALYVGLRDRVREGMGLSDALASVCQGIPRFEQAVLSASERTGAQGAMLSRLAAQLDERREMDSRLRSAIAYPAFVLCAGLGLASLMLYFVVPHAIGLLERAQNGAPRSAMLTASIGRNALTAILALLVAGVAAVFFARSRGRGDMAFASRMERLMSRIPKFGELRARLWSLRFARTMDVMLQAGEPAVDALPLAGLATGSAWLAGLSEEQSQNVRNGSSLSEAIRAMPPLARNLAGWVRIGETSGDLHGMLSQAAERCRQTYDRSLARLLSLLEPALILLVGLLVLAVALTVLAPMLDLALGAAGVD